MPRNVINEHFFGILFCESMYKSLYMDKRMQNNLVKDLINRKRQIAPTCFLGGAIVMLFI